MTLLTWWHIARIFIYLILFLIFIVWLDWIFQRRRIARENNLDYFAAGYGIFKEKGNNQDQTISIINGLLGENPGGVVFGSHFKDEAPNLTAGLHKISRYTTLDAKSEDFSEFMGGGKEISMKYITGNMAGISASARVPKFIGKRQVLKISVNSGEHFYFCYKNTAKNAKAVERLKSHIYSE